jgi:hypothetical protein
MTPARAFLLLVMPVGIVGVVMGAIAPLFPSPYGDLLGAVAFYLLVSIPAFSGVAGFVASKRRRWISGLGAAIIGVPLFYLGFFSAVALREFFELPM